MNIISNKNERTRFLKFAVVGAFGAVVDFGIFNFLTGLLVFNPILASTISFSVAVISNYLFNRIWTFPDSRNKKFGSQLTQFTMVSLVGLGIRALSFTPLEKFVTSISTNLIPQPFFISIKAVGYNLTLALLILIVMFWNFFANRYWTYNDVK